MASWLERLTVVRRCYIRYGIGFVPRYKLMFFSDFQKKASGGTESGLRKISFSFPGGIPLYFEMGMGKGC